MTTSLARKYIRRDKNHYFVQELTEIKVCIQMNIIISYSHEERFLDRSSEALSSFSELLELRNR